MTCTPEKLGQVQQVSTSNKGVGIEDIQKEDEMTDYCVLCVMDKSAYVPASEIHFGRGYCKEHSKGWHPKEDEMKFKVGESVYVKGHGLGTVILSGDKHVEVQLRGYCGFGEGLDWYPISEVQREFVAENYTRLPRKSIRRELKDLRADLRQLAAEAGCKDRILGEQIDLIADKLGELVEKI